MRMRCLQTRRLARIAPPVWRPSRRRSAQFHLFYILLSDLIMVQESKHFQLKTPKLSDLILLCFSGGFEDRMWKPGGLKSNQLLPLSHGRWTQLRAWWPSWARRSRNWKANYLRTRRDLGGDGFTGSLNFQGFPRDFPNISREF